MRERERDCERRRPNGLLEREMTNDQQEHNRLIKASRERNRGQRLERDVSETWMSGTGGKQKRVAYFRCHGDDGIGI